MSPKIYPDDYSGPKAGQSTDEEWLAITEFQAFKYILDSTWTYCDFDCWLATRDTFLYKKGYKYSIERMKKYLSKLK